MIQQSRIVCRKVNSVTKPRMERLLTVFAIVVCFVTMRALGDQCEFGDAAAKEAAKAVSNLAVKLYKQIGKPDENVIFSPVSIALALALVESGAEGGTKNEIQALIGAQGQDDSSNLYQSLQHQLQIKSKDSRLSIANGLFYSEKLRLKSDYVNRMKQCFETQVTKEPFSTQLENARRHINRWVSNATAEKIPELLKQGSIDKNTSAVLANAIYMKAAWENKFYDFERLPFYRSGKTNQAQTVQFMTQENEYGYISTDKFEAAELPYSEAPLSMFIILPKERDGITTVEKALTGDQLISLFGRSEYRRLSLKMPKFTMRQTVELTTVLNNLGVQKMFSNQANFSRMATDKTKISSAVHEAYIKVNENGTEAAAATSGITVLQSAEMPPPPPPFIVNHPFIFAIVHKPTAAIVFMGKVNSVQKQD